SGAADGSGTVTGGPSVGTDTLQYVNAIYGTQYNDTFNSSQFSFILADPTFTTAFNQFRGSGGSDTILGNGNTYVDYSDISTGIVADLPAGTVTHGASTNIPVGSSVPLGPAGIDTINGVYIVVGS